MASINFVDQTTVVPASWLNDVNALVYTVFGGTVSVPSAGKIFRSNGAAMVASTSTFADTYSINTILYASTANTVTGLATGNNGVLVTSAGGVPSISSTLPNGILATTQATHDNSTKVATTAYVDGLVPQAATAGNILLDSGTAWTSAPMTSTGFRNRTINGAMEIDQNNGGASTTVNSAAQVFGPDMWSGFGTGAAGQFTMQQLSSTPPSGFKNYLRIQATTADAAPAATSQYWVDHRIEGLNLIDFQLGTAGAVQFTTSLQMRSSLTGTFSGCFTNGAANRSYPWTCTIGSANTWTSVVVTLTGDTTGTWSTDNTVGLDFFIDLGCGSNFRGTAGAWAASSLRGVTGAVRLISTLNATLDITGVQIEKGAIATAFERRSIQTEMGFCQRYFTKTFLQSVKPANNSGSNAGSLVCGMASLVGGTTFEPSANWSLPVEMRVAPTVTLYTLGTGATGQWGNPNANSANARAGAFGASNRQVQIDNAGTGIAGGQQAYIHATADARL